MPITSAVCANKEPIAPNPIIPRVLPFNSLPLKIFFWDSIDLFSSEESCPCKVLEKIFPWIIPLDARSIPQTTNSLTALALAPGVLKTTIPFSVASFTGILFVPAPALPIHFKESFRSSSERT